MIKRNLFLLTGTILSLGLLIFLSSHIASTNDATHVVNDDYLTAPIQKDWNGCIVKAKSSWGGKCLSYAFSEDMYNVYLVNTCPEKVDLMACVQRQSGQWRCFYRMDMVSNDTLAAYACKGTGKYLKWVRKAGDAQVQFPSVNDVNRQY